MNIGKHMRKELAEESAKIATTYLTDKFYPDADPMIARIEYSLQQLINDMGWGNDLNFVETPERVTRWLRENQGLTIKECREKSKEDLSKRFPTKNSETVTVGPTKVFSLCPHHMLPIEYDVWVSYIPCKTVVGLSKLSRVPQNFARYPFIQEDFTEEISNAVNTSLSPKGVMVIVKGVHNCMRMRGVKQPDALTTTVSLKGVFLKPPKGKDPKGEILRLIDLG